MTAISSQEGLRIVGAVGVGYPPPAGGYAAATYMNSAPDRSRATWVEVRPDSKVMVYAGKVEYGQNVRTGFAIEVADELRVPIEDVEVVLGDTDLTPWDMGTFGSQ
jgi:CO/xanthine dehydrogenase Mo-binding subunit